MDLLKEAGKNTTKKIPLFHKVLSFFFLIRIHTLVFIVLAQYVSSIFIFSKNTAPFKVLFDRDLFWLIGATFFTIASGFIINNFYDLEVDKINKPFKYKIDNFLSQASQLKLYFGFTFLSVFFSGWISLKAVLFFAGFIFLIWLYCHKIKKYPLLSVLWLTFLSLLPFLALLIYHKNISDEIIILACFCFFLVLIKHLLKLLIKSYGDSIIKKRTLVTVYGVRFVRMLISLVIICTSPIIYIALTHKPMGFMKYYFYLGILFFCILLLFIKISDKIRYYHYAHNLIKILIFLGLCSLFF